MKNEVDLQIKKQTNNKQTTTKNGTTKSHKREFFFVDLLQSDVCGDLILYVDF